MHPSDPTSYLVMDLDRRVSEDVCIQAVALGQSICARVLC